MGFQNRHFTSDATSYIPWGSGISYLVDQIVLKDGYLIRCLANHTSGTYATDVQSGYWLMLNPMKNYLINGNFDFWQRGTNFTGNGSGVYGPDRWWIYSANATDTGARSTDIDFTGNYAVQLTRVSSTDFGFAQPLESNISYQLRGKIVTYSVYLKKSAGLTSGNINLFLRYSPSDIDSKYVLTSATVSSIVIPVSSLSSSSYTRFSFITSLPSNITQILATMSTTDTTANNSFFVKGAMLNEGPAPSIFQTAGENSQDELAMCQRYYETVYILGLLGIASSGTEIDTASTFKVTKRVVPPASTGTNTTYTWWVPALATNKVSSTVTPTSISANVGGFFMRIGGFTGLTAGQSVMGTTGNSGVLIFDSEL